MSTILRMTSISALTWPLRSLLPRAALLAVAAAWLFMATGEAQAAKRERQVIPGSYIVVYRGSVDSPSSKTAGLERRKRFRSRLRFGRAVKGFAARLSDQQVRELRADPEVAFVAPDRRVRALDSVPLASGDSAPSGVRRIEAGTPTTAREASSASVAVIDTGIDLSHPDLNAVDGKNCVGTGPAQDDEGHGTHVAGTIAARNNGSGVVGVAPGTKTYAVKVLDSRGSGTISQIICGIDWVTATRTDADPSNDVSVANLSLGGIGDPVKTCSTTTDPMHKAICTSTGAGVTYVVAAGNDGWDFDYAPSPDTPAAYPEVLTVSAMSDSDGAPGAAGGAPGCSPGDADDRYASFSNFAATSAGAAHTIAGPGVCISSTRLGGGQTTMSGTSMAAPHLAGAVALCLGEGGTSGPCAGLSPAQIVSKMRADAESHTTGLPAYGFAGDPTRPAGSAYFGYLSWAGGLTADPEPPADSTPPTVSSVYPSDGALGVDPATAVAAAFSEPMDTAATEAAFSLVRTSDGARVAGSFSWSGDTLVFRPSAPLAGGTSYTARVTTAARDRAGNNLASDKLWTFKTLATVSSFPFAGVIDAGSARSGSYTRVFSNDNFYFQVNSTTSGTRTASWYGRFSGVSNALRSLRVTYSGKSSATCSQTVSIWRWTTNSWVTLDSRSVGTTEIAIDKAVGGTLADYVSGTSGDGEVRLRVRCTRSTSFYTSADFMRITYSKP